MIKVLMFGWEYPPHVYGGLATANFGISEDSMPRATFRSRSVCRGLSATRIIPSPTS